MKESGENYLESIYVLSQRQKEVRATDICAYFGYSRPTVSVALKHFKEQGYVEVDESNHITLTAAGLAIAEKVYERHVVITRMLVHLGVSEEVAAAAACKIEHDLSDETFRCMKAHFLGTSQEEETH